MSDFLSNLAVELTLRIMESGASRLKRAALGEPEQQALRRVYQRALAAALLETTPDEVYRQHLDSLLREFIEQDGVALYLFDLVAKRADPPTRELRQAFKQMGREPDQIDFDALLQSLLRQLDIAIREETSSADSPLFNRLVVLQLASVIDLSEAVLSKIEQVLAASDTRLDINVGDISQANNVAIGENIRMVVHQSVLPEAVIERLVALADQFDVAASPDVPPLPADVPSIDPDSADYIFISYARPDVKTARRVQEYLEAAGFRVFRDESDIHSGANWDITIEQALRDCGRMVLLLSNSSMPFRKEVHREWFFFDQRSKPLHPLRLEDVEDMNSRVQTYNWVDAKDDLYVGLEKLVSALTEPFDPVPSMTPAERVMVSGTGQRRPMPEVMQQLNEVILAEDASINLNEAQVEELIQHRPYTLTEHRLQRIAEWAKPRYQLDRRFVRLTLTVDRGETADVRWQEQARSFDDLREVLDELQGTSPAMVLLGQPGSGKSTLLRRLQMDLAIDGLRAADERMYSFSISLNAYKAPDGQPLPSPAEWLSQQWAEANPNLPTMDTLLNEGRMTLLLDALNEMPHADFNDYGRRISAWKDFLISRVRGGSRVLFTCRTLDYSAPLSSEALRVPQVIVQRMEPEQVRAFLQGYLPDLAADVWDDLEGSPQFDLFRTPYFLKLLVDQVAEYRRIPSGRAELFTGFVRQALLREVRRDNPLFAPNGLITQREQGKIIRRDWGRSPYALPKRGLLLPKLSELAFDMQRAGAATQSSQVRVDYDDACDLLETERDADILRAGVALNVLDEQGDDILFFHQLLQEFFAARQLADQPQPELVAASGRWHVDEVEPRLADVLETLADSDPLPAIPTTGWEETTLLAAAIAPDPAAYLRGLMTQHLALAARAAAAPEVSAPPELITDLQSALLERMANPQADLRARIAAGEALGELTAKADHPHFERHSGPHGDYLLPPLVSIPASSYPIGRDNAPYSQEEPAHTVPLDSYQIARYPVTNAEYALFMAAGGYTDERWWRGTLAMLAWWKGEGSTEGQKQQWRDIKRQLDAMSDEDIMSLVSQNRITSEQADAYITVKNWTESQLEDWMDEQFPVGKIYRQPEFWEDSRFNNPMQPVVGISWFEARAYCVWLREQTGRDFRLPTEAEWEAAARGQTNRQYAYEGEFDPARCNTFETHLRRTAPVGTFPGGETPNTGLVDMSGNTYDWTSSLYDQEQYKYPYRADDGREDPQAEGYRVLRGGSWDFSVQYARVSYRSGSTPSYRDYSRGFRVCVSGPRVP